LADLAVEEVPCVGRRFTWFRPNEAAKRKLDIFFVSDEWIPKWTGFTQFILNRNFSDHCPILLRAKYVDWGPKPFRVMDCWLKDKAFQNLVKETWSNTQLRRWGGYSLKEKIKTLKRKIQQWNKKQFGDTFKKVQQIESTLNKLEVGGNDRQLSSQELTLRKKLQEDLWAASQSHESLLRQKARTRWIRERGCNSKYFHMLMNSNRRRSTVKGMLIEGSWIEEPNRVKEEVCNFFKTRFREPDFGEPELNGTKFKWDQI